jgi:hypothetical protein
MPLGATVLSYSNKTQMRFVAWRQISTLSWSQQLDVCVCVWSAFHFPAASALQTNASWPLFDRKLSRPSQRSSPRAVENRNFCLCWKSNPGSLFRYFIKWTTSAPSSVIAITVPPVTLFHPSRCPGCMKQFCYFRTGKDEVVTVNLLL